MTPHPESVGVEPDMPGATAVLPGARLIVETNPYHPLAHYRQVIVPGPAGTSRTAIVPATAEALPVEAWALALAQHLQETAAPRLAVEPQFTVNLAEPRQTSLLEELRQSPKADQLIVRTYTQPDPAAKTTVRRPTAIESLADELAETDALQPRRQSLREAEFQARFHPSERAAKDYTGSYFGTIMSQDEEEQAKAYQAYREAHREELDALREAKQYGKQFRLLEVASDTWAIWRMAPKGQEFDRGYFLNVAQKPDTPWSGSFSQALDHLTTLMVRRYPTVFAESDSPDSPELKAIRQQWTRQARPADAVSPKWRQLFEKGHTAQVATGLSQPKAVSPSEVSRGPRL